MIWEILMLGGCRAWTENLIKGEGDLDLEEQRKMVEGIADPDILGFVLDEAMKMRKGKYKWHQKDNENCDCGKCNVRRDRELGRGV